ncbi:exonuclease-like protein [Gottschalkia acidurici 9a]|uniref:Exonuclease-like protein n=1 Tax=Gottschalkia acidurici (strain ATCC 7906 / DSM 604 / BCRC 14475 / CIP 104303 / KCTC 5404 / NCIMB 10678 / 9a) TaxID=1128398 RepID=K0B010_GOTA9|nr:ribonuclease H-like domain-containing protein [Gottschalkia acidurici]AFS77951.1 exonuclease-like protein [Gottschalkia acidurici 9a]
MKIFKNDLRNDIYIPNDLKDTLGDTNFCFLDIETTGLSSRYNHIILIGMLCVENHNVYITQLFAESTSEEKELLVSLTELLNNFEHIITYNGSTFDIPFIKNRLTYHNIDSNISMINHLDILKLVRKNKTMLGLSDCKLKTVEKSLGIFRKDTISGKESVELYKVYTTSKNPSIRKTILNHNYDDIFYLPKLLTIYDIIDAKNNLELELSFKEVIVDLSIRKDSFIFKDRLLYIEGKTKLVNLPPQLYYEDFFTLDWNVPNGAFNLNIQYKTGRLSTGEECLYIDLSDTNISLKNINNMKYNIPSNIFLIRINGEIIYDNISYLVREIVFSLG